MIKYFTLDDTNKPGIVKVEIVKSNKKVPISTVKIVEIVRKSDIRRAKIGQKLTVANSMLSDKKPK